MSERIADVAARGEHQREERDTPDEFTEQAKPEKMYVDAGLDATGIVRTVFAALGGARRAARA